MFVTYMDVICLGVLVADIFASPMPALPPGFARSYRWPSRWNKPQKLTREVVTMLAVFRMLPWAYP